MTVRELIQNKYFWYAVFTIVILTLIIYLRISYSTEVECGAGTSLQTLCGEPVKCVKTCPSDRPYNCQMKDCSSCDKSQIECGASKICCDPKSCQGDTCCSQPCKDPNDPSKTICCLAGESCVDGQCKLVCSGSDDPEDSKLYCDKTSSDGVSNMSCGIVENLSPSQIEEIKKKIEEIGNSGSRKGPAAIVDKNGTTVRFCARQKPITWTNEKSMPSQIGNFQTGFNFDKTDSKSGYGFCFPKVDVDKADVNSITNCKQNKNEDSCKDPCEWIDVLKISEETVDVVQKKYEKFSGNSPYGYYCDPSGDSTKVSLGRVVFSRAGVQ